MYEQKLQLLKVRCDNIRIIFKLTIGKIAWVIEAEVLEWNYAQVKFNHTLLKDISFSNYGE